MSDQPNVANNLLYIHHIITRGLNVCLEKSRLFAEQGFPDAAMKEGFITYVQTFATVLDAHHKTEDEMAFPYLRGIVKAAPFEELEKDHKVIEEILPKIKSALNKLGSGSDDRQATQSLIPLLEALKNTWHPHIEKEEKHFSSDVLSRSIVVEEHLRLIQELAGHTRTIAQPDELIVPFLLYNLEKDERAALSKYIPEVITQQLVPVVWKAKWQPMQPFLLS